MPDNGEIQGIISEQDMLKNRLEESGDSSGAQVCEDTIELLMQMLT